jgi:hypothetical protein
VLATRRYTVFRIWTRLVLFTSDNFIFFFGVWLSGLKVGYLETPAAYSAASACAALWLPLGPGTSAWNFQFVHSCSPFSPPPLPPTESLTFSLSNLKIILNRSGNKRTVLRDFLLGFFMNNLPEGIIIIKRNSGITIIMLGKFQSAGIQKNNKINAFIVLVDIRNHIKIILKFY